MFRIRYSLPVLAVALILVFTVGCSQSNGKHQGSSANTTPTEETVTSAPPGRCFRSTRPY